MTKSFVDRLLEVAGKIIFLQQLCAQMQGYGKTQ